MLKPITDSAPAIAIIYIPKVWPILSSKLKLDVNINNVQINLWTISYSQLYNLAKKAHV